MTDFPKTTIREIWEAAAPGWAKWEGVLSKNFIPATDIMFNGANLTEGMRVLDLACGAGSQSLMAAKIVGPEGRIVACDISEEMLKFVEENAAKSGLNNIQTLRSAAEELDRTDETFDAAICQTGLMLFGSPQSALTSVWNTLNPGARCSVMVFSTPQNNQFVAQTMAIALRHAGKKPPAPGGPGLFALASQDILQDLFQKCGFDNVETEIVRVPLNLPSVADTVTMMQDAFGAFRAVLADLDEDGRALAWTEIAICLRQFETQSGLSTELEMLITSGAKPA